MTGRPVLDAAQLRPNGICGVAGNRAARPNIAAVIIGRAGNSSKAWPAESVCTGPATPVGNEHTIHKRQCLDAMILAVADENSDVGLLAVHRSPAVGRIDAAFRRPENPSPPATTSTRSNVLIVSLGISRTKSATWRMERPRSDAVPRAPVHPCRLVFVQHLALALHLAAGGQTCTLTSPRKTCEVVFPACHLDAELRAQIGHGGGGSADGKED